jgi:hypothetical protein
MVNQDRKVSLKINNDLFKKLEQVAAENDRTISSMIRIILKEYFEKLEARRLISFKDLH